MINRSIRLQGCSLALLPAIALALLPRASVTAEVEIHRCLQEDGTVAFQETPCLEPADDSDAGTQEAAETPATSDDFFDFVNPYDEPGEPAQTPEPELAETLSRDRADCEKTTRDAIDAIDLKLRQSTTKEADRNYLDELLVLTQQLRTCKQL